MVLLSFCLYQPLIEIIFINLSWSYGILWFNWSSQVRRDTFRRRINNVAPSVNNPPPLWRFPCTFFWRVRFNQGIGNADYHYRDIYYLVFSLHFLYCHLFVLEWQLWYQVVNKAFSIFPFLGFEQSLIIYFICFLQSYNIVLFICFKKSAPIGIIKHLACFPSLRFMDRVVW